MRIEEIIKDITSKVSADLVSNEQDGIRTYSIFNDQTGLSDIYLLDDTVFIDPTSRGGVISNALFDALDADIEVGWLRNNTLQDHVDRSASDIGYRLNSRWIPSLKEPWDICFNFLKGDKGLTLEFDSRDGILKDYVPLKKKPLSFRYKRARPKEVLDKGYLYDVMHISLAPLEMYDSDGAEFLRQHLRNKSIIQAFNHTAHKRGYSFVELKDNDDHMSLLFEDARRRIYLNLCHHEHEIGDVQFYKDGKPSPLDKKGRRMIKRLHEAYNAFMIAIL